MIQIDGEQASLKRFEGVEIGSFVVRFSANSKGYVMDIRVLPGGKEAVRHIPIESDKRLNR